MSKKKGERKAGAAEGAEPEGRPAGGASPEGGKLSEAIGAMPMNSGACVKCPDEASYAQEGSPAEAEALSRDELERRLRTAECCLAEAKDALVKAQASAEVQRKGAEVAIAEHKDALARALADFDNYRKRVERERENWVRDGRADGACAALDTLDNLDRAAASLPEANRAGVVKVRASLMASLKGLGLEEIDPSGKPFDPNLHEAVMTGQADGVADEMVLEVLAKGYSLGGRLLRPARVKVSKSR